MRRMARVPILGMALLAAACGSTSEPEPEPEVAIMRLTVGAQTINVNAETGAVTGGPITLVANTTTPVSAVFLSANGQAEPLVTDATFRLDVRPADATVTFTRTGPFAGTLRGTTATNTSAEFALFHLEEGHEEFEWPVSITVAGQAQ
ncbi:MAG: hypothetical protein ACT443_03720 [Gemmatimonadota bacterium]